MGFLCRFRSACSRASAPPSTPCHQSNVLTCSSQVGLQGNIRRTALCCAANNACCAAQAWRVSGVAERHRARQAARKHRHVAHCPPIHSSSPIAQISRGQTVGVTSSQARVSSDKSDKPLRSLSRAVRCIMVNSSPAAGTSPASRSARSACPQPRHSLSTHILRLLHSSLRAPAEVRLQMCRNARLSARRKHFEAPTPGSMRHAYAGEETGKGRTSCPRVLAAAACWRMLSRLTCFCTACATQSGSMG